MFRLLIGLYVLVFSVSLFAQNNRNISQYNIQAGLGLKGHDPVAVFSEGGGQAKKGSTAFRYIHEGVTYLFTNSKNEELFKKNPAKYEPTYGGWCAYAMASGAQVDIDPTLVTLHGNRAHYFVSSRAKANFDRNLESFERKADEFWKKISGEEPRL